VISISDYPLRLAFKSSFIVSLLPFVGAVVIFIQKVLPFLYFLLSKVPGYTTTVIPILFIGGV